MCSKIVFQLGMDFCSVVLLNEETVCLWFDASRVAGMVLFDSGDFFYC